MNDCELYAHPNVDGTGCPCGRVVVLHPPTVQRRDPPAWMFQPLPPVLAVIRGDAPVPRARPKAQIRPRLSSRHRPEVWA